MGQSLKELTIKMFKGELPKMAESELAGLRLIECENCVHYKKLIKQCSMCGCWMTIKIKMLEAECPIGKW
jgi:hypothetical protein